MEKNYSLADIATATGDRNDGFLEGNGVIIILLFFLMLGGGFGGFGGWGGNAANGALTRAELSQGFDNQSVLRKLDGITSGLCDGFYAMNTNNLQMQNQLQRDLCQGFAAVNSGIAENRFAAQQCCCETNRNIDAVRYENAQNTCAIVNAINSDGEKTRALITQNEIQALRDKLADTRLELSQVNQNATIIGALQPVAKPSYQVMSPYMSNLYACGYNNSCCCSQFA